MKRLKKTAVAILSMLMMTSVCAFNVSAATVSDGIKAEITVTSQDNDKANIEASVKNANYYEISGINCKLSVSDNAVLSGETVKTDLVLSSEQTESIKAEISLKNSEESQPTESSQEESQEQSTEASQEQSTEPSQEQPESSSNNEPENKPQNSTDKKPDNSSTIKKPDTTDKSTIKTGQDNNIIPVAAVCIVAFAVILACSFKKKNRRMMSVMLCLCMTLSVFAVGASGVNAVEDNTISVITDETVITINGTDVTVTFTVEYPEQPEIHDNTISDLKALNDGKIDITYNDAGEISFLNGKYTDYKVINEETAMSSLQAIESILNAKENDISLIPINIKGSDNGDIYYTFQQNVGAVVLSNTFITIGADKDGNTLCFSSSLQPYAGVKDLEESMITAEQAIAAAEKEMGDGAERVDREPDLDYAFRTSAEKACLCWVVYFKKTDLSEQDSEKSKYIKVYIDAATGEKVDLIYISDIDDYRTSDEVYNNDIYFKDVKTEMMTFTDYIGRTVELPVAETGTGKYYFIDTEKKIICVDTQKAMEVEFAYPIPYEFSSPEDVSPIFVSVFGNMRKVYDKYEENGIKSLDGNGLPIMIGLGYQEYGKEIENACYAGNKFGWGVFMFSKFPISTGLDVMAHEFTHGVKANITGEVAYQNITGAIEESYADILGNLTEMLVDPENSDTENWLVGEGGGIAIRSMSDPHAYGQPEYVGDAFYLMECDFVDTLTDRGGVHINNSILSKICYDMYKSGISMEDSYDLWLNTFLVFNPNADFDDVLGYLKYSAERSDMDEYTNLIQQLFEKAKAVNAQTDSWEGYEIPEGYAKLTLNAHDFPEGLKWAGVVMYGKKQIFVYYDQTGTYSTIIEKGDVALLIRYQDDKNAPIKNFLYAPVDEEHHNLKVDKDEVVVDFSYKDLIPFG